MTEQKPTPFGRGPRVPRIVMRVHWMGRNHLVPCLTIAEREQRGLIEPQHVDGGNS